MASQGYFKIKAKYNLMDLKIGDRIERSDFFTHDASGNAVQLEYIAPEENVQDYTVKPGIFKISKTMFGLQLDPTSFVKDEILEELTSTREIEEIIDTFFSNLHLYAEFGIEIPKRNVLFYGEPGTGKSTSISRVTRKYCDDGKTLIIIWDTARFESYEVKSFIQSFKYEGVEKIILVAEDLGGLENRNRGVMSDSSLLSLLDNNEKTFKIPVMVIATTNFPENLEGNISNRYGRFDDKIEVGYPTPENRQKLLQFFAKTHCTPEALELIASKVCDKFPPSHIREVYIRSRLRSKSLVDVIREMTGETKLYEKGFDKRNDKIGF